MSLCTIDKQEAAGDQHHSVWVAQPAAAGVWALEGAQPKQVCVGVCQLFGWLVGWMVGWQMIVFGPHKVDGNVSI